MCVCVYLQLVAFDMERFKEEEANPAKLQKHMRELSEQLYRNVSVPPDTSAVISHQFYLHPLFALQ